MTLLYVMAAVFCFLSGDLRKCEALTCRVSLPQNVPDKSPCVEMRKTELETTKKMYNLKTQEPTKPYLLADHSPEQLMETIRKDPFIRYYAISYRSSADINEKMREQYIAQHAGQQDEVTDYKEFEKLFQFFKQTGEMMIGEYGRMTSDYEPFMTDKTKWIEDKYFAQQRLAGGNPMTLKRVTFDDSVGLKWSELQKDLNPSFQVAKEVEKIGKMSLNEAIKQNRLYVLRYPELDGMKATSDIMDSDKRRTMWRTLSPIALFLSVSGPAGKRDELKPLAIQMDYTPDSSVFTPDNGDQWMLAKLNLQASDAAYLEIVEHLVKAHFFIEPFCIILWRTLSSRHPLHQILKYHCRGITVPSTFGGPKTIAPKWFMHRLFGCGWEGALHMMQAIYPKFTWDITDLRKDIKDRGLDDKERIPYFPYRDDGEVILQSIETVMTRYVNKYYKDNKAVRQDTELQNFADEVSIDGNRQPTGGLGKVRGFPAKIKTRDQLKSILSRIIWQVTAQHAAVDFALPEYALYVPNVPTRLYNDSRVPPETFSILNLPNRKVSAWALNLMMNVGRFRWDAMFGYGSLLEDHAARGIIYSHRCNILTRLQTELEETNKKRLEDGDLTYPYFIPRWLPNAIQV